MSLWDQVKANMAEWYGVAAERTEEMARIGVRKYDKLTISRTIERAFMELGAHVYGALRADQTDFGQDPVAAAAVARIRNLEEQLAQKELEISEIRSSYRVRPEGPIAPEGKMPGGSQASTGARGEGVAGAAAGGFEVARGTRTGAGEPVDIPGELEGPDFLSSDEGSRPGSGDGPPVLDAWDDELAVWGEPGGDWEETADIEEEPPRGPDDPAPDRPKHKSG